MLSEELDSTAWWAIESLKRAKAIADGNEEPDFYDSPDHEIPPHVRGFFIQPTDTSTKASSSTFRNTPSREFELIVTTKMLCCWTVDVIGAD